MKSASCWFTNHWRVKTKSIGEPYESSIEFNIDKIVADKLEELDITKKKADRKTHYTVVELLNIDSKFPQKRTVGKIKQHLA